MLLKNKDYITYVLYIFDFIRVHIMKNLAVVVEMGMVAEER